jgi:hypothetical protein
MNVIKRPIRSHEEVGTRAQQEILSSCYSFLRNFVRGNRSNQFLMYKHCEFMVHQMRLYKTGALTVSRDIASTMIEIFRDNSDLCRKIPPNFLSTFVEMMFISRDSIYLDYFHVIIKPEDHIIKENQNGILSLLMAREEIRNFLKEERSERLRKEQTPLLGRKVDAKSPRKGQPISSPKKSPQSSPKSPRKTSPKSPRKASPKSPRKASPKSPRKSQPIIDGDSDSDEKPDTTTVNKESSDDDADEGDDLVLLSANRNRSTRTKKLDDYSAGFISLLGLCAEGRNYFTETTCQQLLSLEDAIGIASKGHAR